MKTNMTILATCLSLVLAPVVWAHGDGHDEHAKGHSHEMAELHGGEVTMTPSHHFEVVFGPEEVRLYAYDSEQKPLNDLKAAKATLTLQVKEGNTKELALSYLAPDPKAGRSQGCFTGAYSFEKVKEGQMKATFTMSGMAKNDLQFKTAVRLMESAVYACPMHPDITGEDPISCSKCGMTLTKHEDDHEVDEHSHDGHDH